MGIVQAGGNQQNTVCAHGTRFVDLVGVDHEILAQNRQVARRAGLLEIVDAALKELLVSQHRQAGGTVLGVALGDVGGNEIGAQDALGRAGLFDFGDHRRQTGSDLGPHGAHKVACEHARFGVSPHGTQGLARQSGSDLLAFDCNDFVKNVAHGRGCVGLVKKLLGRPGEPALQPCCVASTSSSSLRRAAPELMAVRASARPP